MKKVVYFLLLLLFSFIVVDAQSKADLVTIIDDCVYVSNNRVSIPVVVKSTSDGVITNLIPEYTLGMIDNNKDVMVVRVSDIKSDYGINNVKIDYNRDNEGKSYVYYDVNKEIKIKRLDTLLSFNFDIEFLENVPNNLYLFGNDLLVSNDKEVCEVINGYKFEEIEKTIYLDNEDNSCYIYLIIILIFILLMTIILQKKKRVLKK